MEWKPIETAPKDGTRILISFGSMGVWAVHWDSMWEETVTEENGIWCVEDNKQEPMALRGYSDEGPRAPTHWMPLPAAPANGID